MKSTIKLFGIIALAAAIGFSFFSCSSGEDDANSDFFGDFKYTETGGKITITWYRGPGGAVSIPAQIDGKPVVAIGGTAFGGRELTSITIPNSVTDIGDDAFYYNKLTSVTIGANVTIGQKAFDNDSGIGGFEFVYLINGRAVGTYTSSTA